MQLLAHRIPYAFWNVFPCLFLLLVLTSVGGLKGMDVPRPILERANKSSKLRQTLNKAQTILTGQ